MSYVVILLLSVIFCEVICGQGIGDNMDRRRRCFVERSRSSSNRSSGQESGMSVMNHDLIFLNEELGIIRKVWGR